MGDALRVVIQQVERDAWGVEIWSGEHREFDSRWVSLRLKTERAARWLGALVRMAIEAGVFAPPKAANVAVSHRAPIVWDRQGDLSFDDETLCRAGRYAAHVEWLDGPQGKGGAYYLGVWTESTSVGAPADFHSAEVYEDLAIRSGDAARFLAELFIDLATAGITAPLISSA